MREKKKSSVTKFSELADMLDDAVIFTDFAGVVKSVNAAAVRAFGENLVGKSINAVVQHSEIESVFARTLEGEKKEDLVYEPAGAVPREFKMRPRRIGNNTVAFLFLDMTLQRNLENVRRDFVANVSHELRSPLTSLAGFVETLLTEDVPDPAMRIRFLKIMEEEAQRMSRLIDDLLSLSRVEVDEHIVPDERVKLVDLLRTVKATLKGRADQRNINIRIDKDESTPESVIIHGSFDEITEVFVNLIENAIKYAFADSEITVRVDMLASTHVRVDVINTGEGIEARHLPRLTERFYRVDKARSRQIGGTGLGLAIVKHIVNRHRGKLLIESVPGATTMFSVVLPLPNGF
jgi:two-component system phosphate regulon sensor histidine kinase PhoR